MCCSRSATPEALMIRDVATRWNSTAELIGRALDLCKALKLLVIMQEYNKPRGVRLQRYQLCDLEWTLLKQLFSLLDVSIHQIVVTCCLNHRIGVSPRDEESFLQLHSVDS